MTQRRKNTYEGERQAPTMVRRSTLYVSVVAALLFGLYMGTLIPALLGTAPQGQAQQAAAPAANSPDAGHINDAEAAAANDPTNAENWIHLGNLYFDANNPEKAVLAYTKALEITPANANVLTDRGTMYRALKQFDLALSSYKQAHKADPKHENSLFNAGIVLYFDLKRKDEAIEMWQQLLRVNPQAKAPNGESVKDLISKLK